MILRLMTRRGAPGWRLSEISKATNLPHPTASRLLKCLVDEGLVVVVRDAATKRYRLGPLNFELGLASGVKHEFRDQIRPILKHLAAETGDTVYLQIRSGLEVVCLDRIDGVTKLRDAILDVGGRRPLGLALPASPCWRAWTKNACAKRLALQARDHILHNSVMRTVAAARQWLWLVRDTTVLGVAGVGIVLPANGAADAWPGVAMRSERFPSHAQQVYEILRRAPPAQAGRRRFKTARQAAVRRSDPAPFHRRRADALEAAVAPIALHVGVGRTAHAAQDLDAHIGAAMLLGRRP